MTRILIVDDERDIRTTLAYNLTYAGFRVLEAGNAFDAVDAVHNASVDLVVLDWVLPDMPGIDLCRKLKTDSRTRGLPVVMLTARADEIDRVVALEVGADDYITKPFSMRETVLRIQRLVRPRGAEETAVFRVGCMSVDQGAQRVWVDDKSVRLTRVEFLLLATLAGRTDFVYSRGELLECVWKRHGENFTRTVDSHVKRLRQKLGRAAAYIQTVQGVGYRLSLGAPQPIAERAAVKTIARHLHAAGRSNSGSLNQRREHRVSREVQRAVELTFEPASSADFDAVFRLLSDSNLPVADLESHLEAFTLAKFGEMTVGTAGLEIYGELALLRSICVVESQRSKRIGVALVSAVASRALAQGVLELYLLTTNAAPYFAKLGFVSVARERTPLQIRSTAQFSALCPSSAVCMRKAIASSLERSGQLD
jgi:two-component system, OmpR family, phosphate regulon response regulator PhoB